MAYDYNPQPQQGNGAFGLVPGNVTPAPNTWSQLSELYPGLTQTGSTALGNINSAMKGNLSSGTMRNLQDAAASRGQAGGTPFTSSSGIPMSGYLASIGMTSEGLQRQGNADFNSFLGAMGPTQTDPSLATGVAQQNAVNNASPNPQAAQTYAEQLYDKYLAQNQANQLALIQQQAASQRSMIPTYASGGSANRPGFSSFRL